MSDLVYTQPSSEELEFYDEPSHKKTQRFNSLVQRQIEGVKLGYRPSMPKGNLRESQWKKWDSKVWNLWLKTQSSSDGDSLQLGTEGRHFHTNPNLSTETQKTTLLRIRVTLPQDTEDE